MESNEPSGLFKITKSTSRCEISMPRERKNLHDYLLTLTISTPRRYIKTRQVSPALNQWKWEAANNSKKKMMNLFSRWLLTRTTGHIKRFQTGSLRNRLILVSRSLALRYKRVGSRGSNGTTCWVAFFGCIELKLQELVTFNQPLHERGWCMVTQREGSGIEPSAQEKGIKWKCKKPWKLGQNDFPLPGRLVEEHDRRVVD